jgi:hypothetical protein
MLAFAVAAEEEARKAGRQEDMYMDVDGCEKSGELETENTGLFGGGGDASGGWAFLSGRELQTFASWQIEEKRDGFTERCEWLDLSSILRFVQHQTYTSWHSRNSNPANKKKVDAGNVEG